MEKKGVRSDTVETDGHCDESNICSSCLKDTRHAIIMLLRTCDFNSANAVVIGKRRHSPSDPH